MIWFKRLFLFFILLLILVVSSGLFINWKYGEDMKTYALEAIRSTIETKTTFNEDVKVSLWNDFPLVAVEIRDVYIQDAFRSDTLLQVEKAFVQFDLLKIIQNNFSIEGILVSNGFLRLKRDEKNAWNFRVWKAGSNSEEKKKVDFSIEILTLENIHLDYDDRTVDLNIQFLSHRSKIKGRFTDSDQRLALSLNGYMEELVMMQQKRIVTMPLTLAGILHIQSKEEIYTIEMANAVLAENEMVFDAEWQRKEDGMHMQLNVHAGNIEPSVLLPHVWPQMPKTIKSLQLQGASDLILTLNGPFTKTQGPQLDATIRMRNGSFLFQNTTISDLNFEGKLFMQNIKQSKAMRVKFESFALKTPKGSVKGSGTLTDLVNPHLKISTSGNSRLEEILTVAGINEETKGSGNVAWNIDFEGPLGKEFNTTLEELKKMRWSGNMDLSETNIQFNSGIPMLNNLTATIAVKGPQTIVKDCSGTIGHLDFEGAIEIAELKQIMTDPEFPVNLSGNIRIKELDITKIPEEWEFEQNTQQSGNSRTVTANVKAEIAIIRYQGFAATNVSGKINMKNNRLTVKELQLKALDGNITSDVTYYPTQTGYQLDVDANLKNVDMSRTLAEWNNFGQSSITSKNLKGRANLELAAEIRLNKNHELLMDELRVETDLEINGGELINFEPLLALSRFISVDELKHVKFDTLQNHVSIKNSRIHIPRMSIASTILNVDVFGEHGFNQEMDYHVNLLLNDILRRESKKQKTFEGHEIIDKKGKTRLFLWVRGTPDDIKIGFDKREVKKKVKEELKKEGQTIKQLFKEEFGRKASTTDEEEPVQFQLEEEENAPENKTQQEPVTSKPTKKKRRGLFNTEPEKDETEGGFEIEFEP